MAPPGDQQDDPRFGDIRIGAIPLGSGILAETFLPPPANGGTDAGDIIFNSSINWQINSNYDLHDRRGPRVRSCPRFGGFVGLHGGDVRHLQRHQAGAD